MPTSFSIWQQAFSAIKSICEKRIIHGDISFRNVRIDDQINGQLQVKGYDFDMVMDIEYEPTGAADRTGTIAFMATLMLDPEPRIHQPVHDCESVFWLCALDLLPRVGMGKTIQRLANIMGSGRSIDMVSDAKEFIVSKLSSTTENAGQTKSFFSLG